MKIKKATLIFPPAFDFSMPYLALPLLKANVEKYCNIQCDVIDLNVSFFEGMIGDKYYESYKSRLNKHILKGHYYESINTAINIEKHFQDKIDDNCKLIDSYKISLKKITPKYNSYYSNNIYKDIINDQNYLSNLFLKIINARTYQQTELFGISVSVEDQIIPAFALARAIRIKYPTAYIIFGGNIITRLYYNIIHSKLCEFIDYMILYEGENELCGLINSINNNKDYSSQKLIRCHNYSISGHPQLLVSTNVDEVEPPSFDISIGSKYLSPLPVVPLLISRKCYWAKCDFCSIHTSWDPVHRVRNIECVIQEIKSNLSKGFQYVRIVDEDCHPNLLDNLSNRILKEELKFNYEAYSRFERKLLDENFCKKLFNSGCKQLFFGLESIGVQTLKLINKGKIYQRETIDRILKNTSAAGILNYVFILTGIPGTSINEESETITYAIENNDIHAIAIGSFVVDINSPIHKETMVRDKYGIELYDIGDITTEVGYSINQKDVTMDVKERCSNYMKQMYYSRPDLAVNSVINEECRFILTSKFGNNFARTYINLIPEEAKNDVIRRAIKLAVENRVERKLIHRGS